MDTLYFRVDDTTRPSYEAKGSTPFTYIAAGREVVVRRYCSVPPEAIDDAAALCELARRALGRVTSGEVTFT